MDPLNLTPLFRDHLRTRLRAQGLIDLDVLVRGSHVVVYGSEADGEKVNRARLTWLRGGIDRGPERLAVARTYPVVKERTYIF